MDHNNWGYELSDLLAERIDQESVEIEFRASVLAIRGTRPPKPAGRAAEILDAAHGVMCELGFEGFSMRQVATRVGISLAAIQYHFPTKDALVNQMIEHRLDWYDESILSHLQGLASDHEASFVALIDWFVDDAASEQTAAFSFHFWALAVNDKAANAALARYMKVYREAIGLLMRRFNPKLDHAESIARGAVLSSLIDGTMSIASKGRLPFKELSDIKTRVRNAALMIASADQGDLR
jgi:AcrR family transcriptional regulator